MLPQFSHNAREWSHNGVTEPLWLVEAAAKAQTSPCKDTGLKPEDPDAPLNPFTY